MVQTSLPDEESLKLNQQDYNDRNKDIDLTPRLQSTLPADLLSSNLNRDLPLFSHRVISDPFPLQCSYNLHTLPDDMVFEVLVRLESGRTVLSLMQVCRSLNTKIISLCNAREEEIWKRVAQKEWRTEADKGRVSWRETWKFTTKTSMLNALSRIEMNLVTRFNDGQVVSSVSLSGMNLAAVPSPLYQLTQLTTLWLSRNHFTSIPEGIFTLTNLEILSLSNNRITEIPAAISRLTKLEELYLYGNQIRTLPSEIGLLSHLKCLSLHHNQLTELPTEIGQLTRLHHLYIHKNLLTSLPASLTLLPSLVGIDYTLSVIAGAHSMLSRNSYASGNTQRTDATRTIVLGKDDPTRQQA